MTMDYNRRTRPVATPRIRVGDVILGDHPGRAADGPRRAGRAAVVGAISLRDLPVTQRHPDPNERAEHQHCPNNEEKTGQECVGLVHREAPHEGYDPGAQDNELEHDSSRPPCPAPHATHASEVGR